MDYWHDILTERSWQKLQEIRKKFRFVLIGGWAVYLWTKMHKSKDIAIVIDIQTLSKLKKMYDLRKNDRLKKYEIKQNEIDLDLYVKYYSKLTIPIEEIKTGMIEGFEVAKPEYLLILKQGSEIDRKESEKGEKDRIDIISILLNCKLDFKVYLKTLKRNRLDSLLDRLIKIVSEFKDYNYLNITPRQLKLKKQEILKELKGLK